MDKDLIGSVVTVLTAIVGVAIIAVLVSPQAKTAGVIQSGGNAFSQMLGAAVSPVTGSGFGFGGFSGGAGMPSLSF
jgi:PRD1 phage membrane DNA delivery